MVRREASLVTRLRVKRRRHGNDFAPCVDSGAASKVRSRLLEVAAATRAVMNVAGEG